MPEYAYRTVDVFTAQRFGGNPLAVFPDARGLTTADMQALAAEMNYSESAFVLPPQDPAAHFRVRIFNRTHEMPFAGHPNVGTAFVLARMGLIEGESACFEEMAGLVEVRLIRGQTGVTGAAIDAPQPLQFLDRLDPAEIAACLQVPVGSIVSSAHQPVRASVGVDFVLAEVTAEALAGAIPDLAAYRRVVAARPDWCGRLSLFAYTRAGEGVRARMFAPLAGTWEDPATGSANTALAALLLSLGSETELEYTAQQGIEMGRPSSLHLRAWRDDSGGLRASVGGTCMEMFAGSVRL